ncbi:hypothetical protein ACFL5Z_16690 [Planctomycetota bacterium]
MIVVRVYTAHLFCVEGIPPSTLIAHANIFDVGNMEWIQVTLWQVR